MSTLTSYNYEDIGDTDEEILTHYTPFGCVRLQHIFDKFTKELNNAENKSSNSAALKRLTRVEKHIRIIKKLLDSKGSSCSIMGGRSRRGKKSKRTRRGKKSKRSKRTRRNH